MFTLKLRTDYNNDLKIIFFVGFCVSFLFYSFCLNTWLDFLGLSSYEYIKPLFLDSKLYEFIKATLTPPPYQPELSTALIYSTGADVSQLVYLTSLKESKTFFLMNCDKNILMLQTFDFSPYSLPYTISMFFNTVFFTLQNILYSIFYIITFYFFFFFFLIQKGFNWVLIGIIKIKIIRWSWVFSWYDSFCGHYFSLEYLVENAIGLGKLIFFSVFFWVPKIFDNFFFIVITISMFWSIAFAWPNLWFFLDNWIAVGINLKITQKKNRFTPGFFHHVAYRSLSELRINSFLQKTLVVFLILFIGTVTTDDIDFVKTVFTFGLLMCFFSFREFINMLLVIFNSIFCLRQKPGYYWLLSVQIICSVFFYFLSVRVFVQIFELDCFVLPKINFFILLFVLMFITVSLSFILNTFFNVNDYYYSTKNNVRAIDQTLLAMARQKLDPFIKFLVNTYRQGDFPRYKDYTTIKNVWQHPHFANSVTSVRLVDMWGYFYNKIPLHHWINISLFFRVYDVFKYWPQKTLHFIYLVQHKFVNLTQALFYQTKFISKLRYITTPKTKFNRRNYNTILSNLTATHLSKKTFTQWAPQVMNILQSKNFYLSKTPLKLMENLSSLYIKPLWLKFYISKKPFKTWINLVMYYKNLKKLFRPEDPSRVPENKDKKFAKDFLTQIIKHIIMYRNELISYSNTKIYLRPSINNKNFYYTAYLLKLWNEFLTKTTYSIELLSDDEEFDFMVNCLIEGCSNQPTKFNFLHSNKKATITPFSRIMYKKYKFYALNPDKHILEKFLLKRNNLILSHTVEELIDITTKEYKLGPIIREKQFKTIQRWTYAEDYEFIPEPGKIRYWVCTPKSKVDMKATQKYYINYFLDNEESPCTKVHLFYKLLQKNMKNNHKLYFDKNLFIVSYGQTHSSHFMQTNKKFYEYTFCNHILQNFDVKSITRNWLKLKSFSIALSYTNLSNHISIVPKLYKLYTNQTLKAFLPQNFLLSRPDTINTMPKQLFFSVNIEIMQQFRITFDDNEWNNQVIEFFTSDKKAAKENPKWRDLLKKIDKISLENINNYELIVTADDRASFSFFEILASYWKSSYYYCKQAVILTKTYFTVSELVPENTKSCQYKAKKLDYIIKKTTSFFSGK